MRDSPCTPRLRSVSSYGNIRAVTTARSLNKSLQNLSLTEECKMLEIGSSGRDSHGCDFLKLHTPGPHPFPALTACPTVPSAGPGVSLWRRRGRRGGRGGGTTWEAHVSSGRPC